MVVLGHRLLLLWRLLSWLLGSLLVLGLVEFLLHEGQHLLDHVLAHLVGAGVGCVLRAWISSPTAARRTRGLLLLLLLRLLLLRLGRLILIGVEEVPELVLVRDLVLTFSLAGLK